MADMIGWFASVVLVATIFSQIYKQWNDRTSKGVSVWLFIGQIVASAAFTVYSVLLRNYVFIVTNSVMFVAATTQYFAT